jgi:5-methylcytosine-specific restriction protein A
MSKGMNIEMKIDHIKYREAYQMARKVHAGQMHTGDALDQLEKDGVNRASADYLIKNFYHLISGRVYKRTMSIAVTDYYLTWIGEDYGHVVLKMAVSALAQHIEYFQGLKNSRMPGYIKILQKHEKLLNSAIEAFFPEEIGEAEKFIEGRTKAITVNIYERSTKARKLCIEVYGYMCAVCGFDFEKTYGAIGQGFIHVHHLRDFASITEAYELDPKEDLRPVCPNCHAMLHKKSPPFSIEGLRKLVRR